MKLQILLVVSGMAVSLLCGCARTEAAAPSSSAEEGSSTVQTTGSAVESTGESLLEGVEITLPDSITRQPVSDTREHFCLDGEVVGGIELLDIAGQMDTMSMGDYAQQALTVTKAVYDTEYDYMAEGDSFCKAVVSMSSREGREFYHYFFQGEEMGYDVWIDNSVMDTLEMKSCLKTLRAGDLELPQEDMTKNETPLLTLRMTLPDGITKQPKRTTRTLLYSGQTLAGGIEQITGATDAEALNTLALSVAQELYGGEFTHTPREETDGNALAVVDTEKEGVHLVHYVIQVGEETYDVWTDTSLISEEEALEIAQSCQY